MSAAPPEVHVPDRHGHLGVRLAADNVVVVEMHGGLTDAVMPRTLAAIDEVMTREPAIALFVDGERLESYTTAFRKDWQNWLRIREPGLSSIHVLVRSPVVRMGLGLVNAVVRQTIRAHDDRASFDAALRDAVAGDAN